MKRNCLMRIFCSVIVAIILIQVGCTNRLAVESTSSGEAAREKQFHILNGTNQSISKNQDTEKTAFYRNFSMVNETAGWILRNNKLLRTVNGGLDWDDVSPYSDMEANNNDQSSVSTYFYDSNFAWVALGTYLQDNSTKLIIFYTTDGGTHWNKTFVPITEQWESGSEGYISFSDCINGFLLLTSSPSLGQMNKSMYKTNDGGKSWSRIGNITDEIESYPTGMAFKNIKEGWITSSYHGQNYILTFKTDDGGRNWHKENLQITSMYNDYYTDSYAPVFFSNEKKNGILPLKYVKEESRFIIPYITKDGGESWSATKVLGNYTFSIYDFLSEKQWWAIDYKDNKLYETNNSGVSFEAVSENKIFKDIKTLEFVTNQIGWAIGQDFFIKTIDGGKSWSKVNFIK